MRLYKDLRSQIHHGPLYTKAPPRDPHTAPKVFGEEQENEVFEVRGRTDTDPFVGVPTYTMKYDRKERAIPVLSGRPFSESFFYLFLVGTTPPNCRPNGQRESVSADASR